MKTPVESVFYMDSTGVFMLAAFYAYLVCLLIMPYTRSMLYKTRGDLVNIGVYFISPLVLVLGLFYKVAGGHIFTGLFWRNFFETAEYFLSGIGTYPIFENFKYHNFFAGIVGLIIPAVWIFTILFVGAMCYFKKFSRRHIFVVVISIYGLGLNHYYIARAIQSSYYVTGLPFVFVLGYWFKLFFWSWPGRLRINAVLVFLAISIYCLFTNHNFMAYPNIFNWSRNPMIDALTAQPLPADLSTYFNHLYRNQPETLKLPTNSYDNQNEELYTEHDFASDDDLVAYYHQKFDFHKDAALIQSLTEAGKPVALISSFETTILAQADRPPFFYYFPLLNSQPQFMRVMPFGFVHTNAQRFEKKTIEQLESGKPEYIFLERIFLYDAPKAYRDNPENIIPIIAYVRTCYLPWQRGERLVVMKRRSDLGSDQK